ncbi:hypothetical protein [Halomarina litorea]|uniref:hypothetical protein n=1 Tax=Halomarina litorea TaxID=2961595 RepID=UPI0020C21C35|nr:hypothetical protein [Halomarina sp. BCD28]
MKHDTKDIRITARTARLKASADGVDDDGPWTFSGLAVAAGDILHMADGTPVLFTEEELRTAAPTQSSQPLTKDHPSYDDPQRPNDYPPDTDDTIGTVEAADYVQDAEEGVEGVGYNAKTHDEQIARGVKAGSFDVSVHPSFDLGPKDETTGAYIATDIQFLDLSVVSKGDSPNNTANWGPSQQLAAWSQTHDVGELLDASAGSRTPPAVDDDQIESIASRFVQSLTAAIRGGDHDATDDGEADQQGGDADDGGDEQSGDEPADTGADSSSSTQMQDFNRDDAIEQLVSSHDFTEESLAEMDDDDLKRTHDAIVDVDGDGGDGDDAGMQDQPADGGAATANALDLGDHDSLEAAIDSAVEQRVQEQREQDEKADLVADIIAQHEDYDADDREELLASAPSVLEKIKSQAHETTAAQIPGTVGADLTASVGGSDGDGDDEEWSDGVVN